MPGRVDTLEQHESLKAPLVVSSVAHIAVFSLMAFYTIIGARGRVLWGNPHSLGGGGSVGVTSVKQLPLPTRTGAANPLANDTESRVPQPPKPEPRRVRAPEPDAIPIRGRARAAQPKPARPQNYSQYRPSPERPNQLYSNSGQALSSNMFGAQSGTGGVGMGPGSAFGNRFGWYRDLIEQRVAQKWHTDDVDPRLQTAPPVIVTFEIQRNGMISSVRILQSSGNRALDYSAQRAVYEVGQLPPLPQGYDRSNANIEIWFQLKR